MAIDKAINSAQLDADLTSVADAIRAKGGTSAALTFPAGFVSAVEAIETGGGEYSADDIAEANISGAVVLKSATTVETSAFEGTSVESVIGDTVTRIYNYSFRNCKNLVSMQFPNAKSVGMGIFSDCATLAKISYGDFLLADGVSQSMFSNCSNLSVIVMPSAREIGYMATGKCTNLTSVDIKGGGTIHGGAFGTCAMNVLILRETSKITALAGSAAFNNTPFASGGSGGTLYVPSAQIEDFKSATNWSTILGYENNQILPIEGSIYETQYADGTPIT